MGTSKIILLDSITGVIINKTSNGACLFTQEDGSCPVSFSVRFCGTGHHVDSIHIVDPYQDGSQLLRVQLTERCSGHSFEVFAAELSFEALDTIWCMVSALLN